MNLIYIYVHIINYTFFNALSSTPLKAMMFNVYEMHKRNRYLIIDISYFFIVVVL
jgi:hypothetical protein